MLFAVGDATKHMPSFGDTCASLVSKSLYLKTQEKTFNFTPFHFFENTVLNLVLFNLTCYQFF